MAEPQPNPRPTNLAPSTAGREAAVNAHLADEGAFTTTTDVQPATTANRSYGAPANNSRGPSRRGR